MNININLNTIKAITKHKSIYPLIALSVVVILLLGSLYFLGNSVFEKFQTLQSKKDEVANLRSQVILVRNNTQIFSGNIDEYIDTLNKLIPDEESYFSVISALETLANKTGVTISSYTINLDSTTEEKLTLTLNINGDPVSLNKLLSDYMFTSGRLITNDSAKIGLNQDGKTLTISFNLFHKAFKDAVSPGSVVTQKDLDSLDDIRTRMQ